MEASLKKILRGISLELRHTLEGWHDKKTGAWNPGDLERRLNEIGAWGDRPSKPLDEMRLIHFSTAMPLCNSSVPGMPISRITASGLAS